MDGITGHASTAWEGAAEAIGRDGVAKIEGLFDPALITDLRNNLAKAVPGAFSREAPAPEQLWDVGNRRINGLVIIEGRMRRSLDLLLQPVLLALLERLLGNDWKYESFGLITAYGGAEEQQIHSDAPTLFPGHGADPMLPAYALTISIPLVPLSQAGNGSTEFALGSHRQPDRDYETFVGCDAAVGDCMIWDYRVRHRGQPNRTDHARPLLYATAARKFWTDTYNFSPRNNRRLVIDARELKAVDKAVRHRFDRAYDLPGLSQMVRLASQWLRWRAPFLHRAMRTLAGRREIPR